MKFSSKRNDALVNGVRPGFSAADSHFLNRQIHTPKTQIFSSEELDEEPEDRIYYCAMCKGVLDYDKHLDAYACKSCVQYYDITNLQDTPLKDIKDLQLVPYSAQRHYAPFDPDDPNTPFVESIPLDKTEEEEWEEEREW